MEALGEYFSIIPFYTRIWLVCTVFVSTIAHSGLVQPNRLTLSYSSIFRDFQIWRLVTSIFYYPTKRNSTLNFVANLHIICSYASSIENGSRPLDYCHLLWYFWVCRVSLAFYLRTPVLMDSMTMSVLYVWCQAYPDSYEPFLCNRVKAIYLPLCFIGLKVLGRKGSEALLGCVIGHVYFYAPAWFSKDISTFEAS